MLSVFVYTSRRLIDLSLPLSLSLDFRYSDSNGGRCLARLVNRNYVDGNFTALIVWDMVWAYD